MFIKIICIIVLLEFSLSDEYDANMLPMNKDSKYGDDVCSYTEDEKRYVKPCGKGKFCDGSSTITTVDYLKGKYENDKTSYIEICQDLPNITDFYTYKGSCSNDFECESGYECIGNECSYKCPNTNMFLYNPSLSNPCLPNSDKGTDGICYEATRKKNAATEFKYSSPEPNKICGKLTFADDPNDNMKGIYYINKMEYVYKGEVEDGEYVNDQELCKSGFALYFYKDGKSKDPKDSGAVGSNTMYLMCVTPISINSKLSQQTSGTPIVTTVDECSINYKINENGEILRYNIKHLTTPQSTFIENYCKSNDRLYIKLKYEKYREYYTKITEEERQTCGDLDYTNKYSCQNNELIKAWYFYNNPRDYAIYNDRKKIGKVIDYKIQKSYPCYSISQYLSKNFIYLLFLLLI